MGPSYTGLEPTEREKDGDEAHSQDPTNTQLLISQIETLECQSNLDCGWGSGVATRAPFPG